MNNNKLRSVIAVCDWTLDLIGQNDDGLTSSDVLDSERVDLDDQALADTGHLLR